MCDARLRVGREEVACEFPDGHPPGHKAEAVIEVEVYGPWDAGDVEDPWIQYERVTVEWDYPARSVLVSAGNSDSAREGEGG